jgi:hypothetical protein
VELYLPTSPLIKHREHYLSLSKVEKVAAVCQMMIMTANIHCIDQHDSLEWHRYEDHNFCSVVSLPVFCKVTNGVM